MQSKNSELYAVFKTKDHVTKKYYKYSALPNVKPRKPYTVLIAVCLLSKYEKKNRV